MLERMLLKRCSAKVFTRVKYKDLILIYSMYSFIYIVGFNSKNRSCVLFKSYLA
ncbi:hypothetical protein C2G38_2094886 [Gigaspora rosea]|uniref:Uncharacterized protein n=1 Tax=Gigaspora rosea TaxID=44941 RepID=A0A397UWZ5_9GLOM|nr:hypothetical protein C2G38_2125506 [Gigaspora rosea]RIB14764.1 hypothetical protein C2G38_2094886 [Gigaspora rosea]